MRQKLLTLILVTTLPIALIVSVYWFWTNGYVEVRLPSPNESSVQLLAQADQKVTDLKAKGNSVKKRVRHGHYEVLVRQGNTSYFTVLKSKGWLGTTVIEPALSPEKQRQFVGDNPGPCGAYNNQVLLTFGCNDSFRNALLHVPATTKQPTLVLKPENSTEGTIEGIAQTSEGLVAVLKRPVGIDSDLLPAHGAYVLNDKATPTNGVVLKDLEDAKTYRVAPYKQGLLLYTEVPVKLLYFPTRGSTPVTVQAGEFDKKMTPYGVWVNGDNIVVAADEDGKEVDLDAHEDVKIRSQAVIINPQQQSKRLKLDKRYAELTVCGSERLCGLLNRRMDVYDIAGDKSELLFSVGNVDDLYAQNNRVILLRGSELLSLDTEKQAGSVEYSLGDYSGCGLLPINPTSVGGYTLCVTRGGKKVALLINSSATNTDSIDKKIAELANTSEIENLTIYGAIIHITPEAGEPVYDAATKGFRYSPAALQQARSVINQTIDRIGIDRSKYQIIL